MCDAYAGRHSGPICAITKPTVYIYSSVTQKESPLSDARQRCSVHDVSVTSLSVVHKVDLHMRVASHHSSNLNLKT